MKCGISYHVNKFCDGRTHGRTDGYHSYGPPLGATGDKNWVYATPALNLRDPERRIQQELVALQRILVLYIEQYETEVHPAPWSTG